MNKIKVIGRYLGNDSAGIMFAGVLFRINVWTEANVGVKDYNEMLAGTYDGWFEIIEPITRAEMERLISVFRYRSDMAVPIFEEIVGARMGFPTLREAMIDLANDVGANSRELQTLSDLLATHGKSIDDVRVFAEDVSAKATKIQEDIDFNEPRIEYAENVLTNIHEMHANHKIILTEIHNSISYNSTQATTIRSGEYVDGTRANGTIQMRIDGETIYVKNGKVLSDWEYGCNMMHLGDNGIVEFRTSGKNIANVGFFRVWGTDYGQLVGQPTNELMTLDFTEIDARVIAPGYMLPGTYTMRFRLTGTGTDGIIMKFRTSFNPNVVDDDNYLFRLIIPMTELNPTVTFTVPTTVRSISIEPVSINTKVITAENIQMESGDLATPFRTYESNELRTVVSESIRRLPNGTCDSISKEGTLTRRTGSTVLDGTGVFSGFGARNSEVTTFAVLMDLETFSSIDGPKKGVSSSMGYTIAYNDIRTKDVEGIAFDVTGTKVAISVLKGRLPGWNDNLNLIEKIQLLREWLNLNNIILFYPKKITSETILPIELGTFDDVTYIFSTGEVEPSLMEIETTSNLGESVSVHSRRISNLMKIISGNQLGLDLSETGFEVKASGIVEEWGVITVPAWGQITVSLPLQFKQKGLNVLATAEHDTDFANVAVSDLTTSSFKVVSDKNCKVRWQARGK